MGLLDDLTGPQREAVTHGEGPMLVLAAAGSGKTRVITRRIAYLLENGAEPWQILAITFTNKAAGEMRERVGQFADASRMWIGTFHSIGARILRRHAEKIGFRTDFAVYDTADSQAILKRQLKILEIDPSVLGPRQVLGAIRKFKNAFQSPEAAAEEATNDRERTIVSLYLRYRDALKEANALDFDDLLCKTVALLQDNRDVLDGYNDQFHYVLADEFQDTNPVQYALLRQLSFRRRSLCATGDPDQSIYAWRGATIRNILTFEKDFPDARVVRLEENFRSTKTILRAADSLIRNNTVRKEKALVTNNEQGEKIELWTCLTATDEASETARRAAELIRDGCAPSQIAVFYRVNAMSRLLEDAMRAREVPYLIVGSVEFYRRAEVKDVLAYARLVANPDDDVSFERIVNVPTRGIGETTMKKMRALAAERGTSLARAVRAAVREGIGNARMLGSLEKFLDLLSVLRKSLDRPPAVLLQRAVTEIDYKTYLESQDKLKAEERMENVSELISAASEYASSEPSGGLTGFLERTALVSDTDALEGTPERVSLMTIHSAKGLEFDAVFIAGAEEGLMPHSLSLDTPDKIEEERRLLFVAITRARKRLWIAHSLERTTHGNTFSKPGSRFLRELPKDLLTLRTVGTPARPSVSRPTYTPRSRPARAPEPAVAAIETGRPKAYHGARFCSGDIVRHGKFGLGRVVALSGAGEKARAQVDFEAAGVKSLILKYAGLQKA